MAVTIKELNLKSFGKFKDFKLELHDGLNIIFGDNEAGKTTIQLFIKTMFYGFQKQSRRTGLTDRERARPWDGSACSGSIIFSDGAREIEIVRKFGKTKSGDKVEAFDTVTGERIPEYSVNEPGKAIFDMSCGMFEKTIWIKQGGVPISGRDDEIINKLINLSETGADDVSVSKAFDKLKSQRVGLKADGRVRRPGIIDSLEEKRRTLKAEALREEDIKRQIESCQKRIEALKNENVILESRASEIKVRVKADKDREKVDRAEKLSRCIKKKKTLLNTKAYRNMQGVSKDEVDGINELSEKLESRAGAVEELENNDIYELQEKRSGLKTIGRFGLIFIALGLVLLITSGQIVSAAEIAATVKTAFYVLGIAVLALGAGLSIYVGFYGRKLKRLIRLAQLDFEDGKAEFSAETDRLKKELRDRLAEFGCEDIDEFGIMYGEYRRTASELEALDNVYRAFLGSDEIHKLLEEAAELKNSNSIDTTKPAPANADGLLEDIQRRIAENNDNISKIENKVGYEYRSKNNLADIRSEIESVENGIRSAYDELEAVKLAEDVLSEAYNTVKSDFTPYVNAEAKKIIMRLTNGKYNDIRVSDGFDVMISDSDRYHVEAEYMSMGTYEQIYFALRMAVAKLTSGEDCMMFFDDIFMTFDDGRAYEALKYICGEAKTRQILLFTCRGSDVRNAEKLDKSGASVLDLNEMQKSALNIESTAR